MSSPLPRRCLHGVHRGAMPSMPGPLGFASALPARGASVPEVLEQHREDFASTLPARGASSACYWPGI